MVFLQHLEKRPWRKQPGILFLEADKYFLERSLLALRGGGEDSLGIQNELFLLQGGDQTSCETLRDLLRDCHTCSNRIIPKRKSQGVYNDPESQVTQAEKRQL